MSKDSPLAFIGNADQFKDDKIFKMLEMDPTDPRYIALTEAVKAQRQNQASDENIRYSDEWYVCNKGDANFKPPKEGLDKEAYIAVCTYIALEENAALKNQVLEEMKALAPELVLPCIEYRQGDANFGRNIDICCLPVLSPPLPENNCLRHAALMTVIIENLHDLRMKLGEYSHDVRFAPNYTKN